MKKIALILLPLLCLNSYAQKSMSRQASSVIIDNKARFTVITPRLIRMEYDSTGKFVDEPSFVAVNRNMQTTSFKQTKKGSWVILATDYLELRYQTGSGKFNNQNLKIAYTANNFKKFIWQPGLENNENLKGTYRTLDGMNGNMHEGDNKEMQIEDGLLSRNGWTLIDDSNNFLFDNSDWNWVKTRTNKETDWYFLGYGNDFKSALTDFTQIAGRIPLPPRYAFGYWWSRYWNYSDTELRDLVKRFEQYNIPLDILVIDMDWHTTDGLTFQNRNKKDEFGQPFGWTGYTWNKSLFPDPANLLQWINDKHLKTTLNLHPASGIAPTEEKYGTFAKAMNFDTTGHKNIPFEAADKKYMSNLFNLVLDPIKKQGVTFWWLDWQQWPYSQTTPALSNTWWLNYIFFSRMEQQGEQRPMLYHRWGGLGNHRYQIGFSGDAIISWKSLELQPGFTATASNVLYGYWSHDLGGHMFGNVPDSLKKIDPEMYVRWLQYGVFSPIFRTHSSKDPRLQKEVWNFTGEYFDALNNAIHLRYQLAPYIYTMARKAYETGISLCRPMYYDYPADKESYLFKNEYMFGDELLIAPVTTPAEGDLSKVKVWLPGGNEWYEWSTGTLLKGGQILDRNFLLGEFPVYTKAGAIIPMYDNIKNLQENSKNLIVKIFPGGNYKTRLYEDAGDNNNYKDNEYTYTGIETEKQTDGSLNITVQPREGSFPGMIEKRDIEFRLYGSAVPSTVYLNGVKLAFGTAAENHWSYSGEDLTLHIFASQTHCDKPTFVTVQYNQQTADLNGVIGKMSRLKKVVSILKNNWFDVSPIPDLLSSVNQTALQIEYTPDRFNSLVTSFVNNYPTLDNLIKNTIVKDKIKVRCSRLLSDK